MRSVLTMLGIIIGITAVIAIMTIGASMQGYLEDTMSGMGINNVTVSLRAKNDQGPALNPRGGETSVMGRINQNDLMTDEMLSSLQAQYPDDIKAFSISAGVGSGQTVKGGDYANLSLMGVNPEYSVANNLTMLEGRFIMDSDNTAMRRLAVVSDKLVGNIFGSDDPIGQEITVQTQNHIDTYTIIGVYQYDSGGMAALMNFSTSSEYDVSTDVYIPLSVAQRINNSHGYQSFTVMTQTGVNSTDFGTKIESFFGRYYSHNTDYSVSAFSMESIVSQVTSMLNTMSIAIAAIAAISLLVGGIGVMNIMMVSITERTREIGTRKAIGATNGEIRTQFIVEAVVICIIGGLIGIICGTALGAVGAQLLSFPARASVSSILLSVGVSMAIGIFFGYYPANKAARMDPIDALRYE